MVTTWHGMGLVEGRTITVLNQHINTESKAAVVYFLGMTLLLFPLAGYAKGASEARLDLET